MITLFGSAYFRRIRALAGGATCRRQNKNYTKKSLHTYAALSTLFTPIGRTLDQIV
jgi:hypothetical protein